MVLAGAAVALFLGGLAGLVAAPAAAVGTWLVIERSEPAALRHDRAVARRDLPHVVGLLADALRSGQSPTDALAVVVTALPGPATARLAEVVPRLRLGLDPMTVWGEVAADPALGRLGSAMARAHRTGAPVVPAVERLADELSRSAHAEVEDRARAVGVKAALPAGPVPAAGVRADRHRPRGGRAADEPRSLAAWPPTVHSKPDPTGSPQLPSGPRRTEGPAPQSSRSQAAPRPRPRRSPMHHTTRSRDERGITTAEYAVGTAAGAGLAGLLYKMLTGGFGDKLLKLLYDHVLGLLGIG